MILVHGTAVQNLRFCKCGGSSVGRDDYNVLTSLISCRNGTTSYRQLTLHPCQCTGVSLAVSISLKQMNCWKSLGRSPLIGAHCDTEFETNCVWFLEYSHYLGIILWICFNWMCQIKESTPNLLFWSSFEFNGINPENVFFTFLVHFGTKIDWLRC